MRLLVDHCSRGTRRYKEYDWRTQKSTKVSWNRKTACSVVSSNSQFRAMGFERVVLTSKRASQDPSNWLNAFALG